MENIVEKISEVENQTKLLEISKENLAIEIVKQLTLDMQGKSVQELRKMTLDFISHNQVSTNLANKIKNKVDQHIEGLILSQLPVNQSIKIEEIDLVKISQTLNSALHLGVVKRHQQ